MYFKTAYRLANTKYKSDENVQVWLRMYNEGTKNIKHHKKIIQGMKLHSDFVKKNLIKAIELREYKQIYKK